MELRYVIPNMEKTFGNLEFGGKVGARRGDTTRQGSRVVTRYRRYKLFSDVQRADDIEVVVSGKAGESGLIIWSRSSWSIPRSPWRAMRWMAVALRIISSMQTIL